MENQMSDSCDNSGTAKKFPVGMSVLVADNDLIFLKELETLLSNASTRKPRRIEELKHIWQHVVQRKKFDKKDQNKPSQNNMAEEGNARKTRFIWSPELHKKFVAAIDRLGLERAVPREVLEMMNVEGLTRENVASHLQKYRLYTKRRAQQAEMADALSGLKRLKIV